MRSPPSSRLRRNGLRFQNFGQLAGWWEREPLSIRPPDQEFEVHLGLPGEEGLAIERLSSPFLFSLSIRLRSVPKVADKRVWMSDFPASIECLRGADGKPYYKVQPEYPGRVLSHSVRPQGGAHAREWENGEEDRSTSTFVPDSVIFRFRVEPGRYYRLRVPETAATASFGPAEYDCFMGFKAVKKEDGKYVDVTSPTRTTLSVIFWEGGPGKYRLIEFAAQGGLKTKARDQQD